MKAYYDEGGITIFNADCRDVLPTLGAVDLVLTDPPYTAQTHAGARKGNSNGVLGEFPPLPLVDFASFSIEEQREHFNAIAQVAKGWVISFLDWQHTAAFASCPPRDLRFVRAGIWVKPDAAPQFTGDRPSMGWESIAFMHRVGGRMKWNGGGRDSVFTCGKAHGLHPTQKPLPLVKRLVQLFSNTGDVILDAFGGSGTTAVAAKELGRRCILIEREERYCEIAANRLSQNVFDFEVAL